MPSLETTYLGLKLKSPIIVGSSGLTNSVAKVTDLETQGAGAVVLKSLFEEQILHEAHHVIQQDEMTNMYPEALDYIRNYSREQSLSNYLNLIKECKAKVKIPVIASINCFTPGEWVSYAKMIEDAGADALELNIFVLPSDPEHSTEKNEAVYFAILEKLIRLVKIPVALKISHYFSALATTARKLDWSGAKGLVLFNRFFSPDIDIEAMKVVPSRIFSEPSDIAMPLRWTALLSGQLKCDLAASTGVYSGKDVIKLLLAGASAVQVVSSIYDKGSAHLGVMLDEVKTWMDKHGYDSITGFKGLLSYKNVENPAAYERVQFMKHFAGIE